MWESLSGCETHNFAIKSDFISICVIPSKIRIVCNNHNLLTYSISKQNYIVQYEEKKFLGNFIHNAANFIEY